MLFSRKKLLKLIMSINMENLTNLAKLFLKQLHK